MTTWLVRYAGSCTDCGAELPAGSPASWDRTTRTLRCLGCAGGEMVVGAVDPGVAGRSARSEHDRRVARHEAAIDERWGTGIAGRVVKALSTEPQSTRAWASGAAGEERLAEILARVEGIRVLHDRGVPGSRANIDHLVVAQSGVFVIDAKNHHGMVRVEGGGLLGRREPRLTVDRRDQSAMADGMLRQVEIVTEALGVLQSAPPVWPVLCFLSADWPLIDPPRRFRGVLLEGPRSVVRLVCGAGPLTKAEIDELAGRLAARLPPR